MNKPRLVKREKISLQNAKPAPAPSQPSLAQIRQAVQERKQPRTGATASLNARAAFAALFASV
ncbi:MAG: hypothetical protein ABI977_19160 [Acidobacteriota bacterium]